MKEIEGDLIKLADEGKFDIIAHGCNCHCTMGAGIAKSLKDRWPEVYQVDKLTEKSDPSKLGTISGTLVDDKSGQLFWVANLYTQFDYSPRGKRHVEYGALRAALMNLKSDVIDIQPNPKEVRIGLPLIGAGLAGGDWKVIKAIIEDVLYGYDVTIVHFKP